MAALSEEPAIEVVRTKKAYFVKSTNNGVLLIVGDKIKPFNIKVKLVE